MTALSGSSWWFPATRNLRGLVEAHGDQAARRAGEYSDAYQGRRGLMVYDVVASRQRKYVSRVLPMVERFHARSAASSLADVAKAVDADLDVGLRKGEADTMRAVARGLLRFSEERDLGDDEGSLAWAVSVIDLEHAQRLDPYVGVVSGIGPALFAYLRMRSGADAIKPDLRVKAALKKLGFEVPGDEHSLLVATRLAAQEVGIDRLVLDQLLWWLAEDSPSAE